jgi:allantoicase
MTDDNSDKSFATAWVNLAQPRLGAKALYATDDFFAPKERMLNPEPPVFIPDKYDDNGKWMDGWESRRKRDQGYDYCIVRLGLPGIIKGVDIDTSHFTGNYAPAASIDACYCAGDPDDDTAWSEIVASTTLGGNARHLIAVADPRTWSHVRLNIYPDGGVARLRVYGQVQCNWETRDRDEVIDLVALVNGGRGIACNDSHYGTPDNLLAPGRGVDMGDGWETRRRREPGNDWAIFALGHPGEVAKVEIDTAHYKGNFPDRCSLQAALVRGGTEHSLISQSMFWQTLLPEQPMRADHQHLFEGELNAVGPISHVRLNIFPDGGVSRLRLFGRIVG